MGKRGTHPKRGTVNGRRKDLDEIGRLLDPESVAVVGASTMKGKVGNIVFEGLRRSKARLYPVNPHEEIIYGHKSYASVSELPVTADVVVIAVRADRAVEIAEECAESGIPFIIIVAAGFGETGEDGKALEARLKSIPSRYPTRILGPNSLGVFVPQHSFDTIFVEHGDRALAEGGGVAFVSQSGSVGVEALGLASNTGFPLRAFVGLGNKIDLDEMDFLRYFGADDKTDCIALYIENVVRGREFLEQAHRVSLCKPVVALKAGRTPAGATAVRSHTGKLAGSDRVVSGAFRQYGIQRAFDDEELCDAAKTLSYLPPAQGNRVAVISGAGGFGVICADYVETDSPRARLRMAELSGRTISRIREVAPPFASCRNPVDLTAGMTNPMFVRALQALLEDDGVDIVISITFFAPHAITDTLIDEAAEVTRDSRKAVVVFTEYGPFTDTYLKEFYRKRMIGFPSLTRTVRAVRFLVERGRILSAFEERG
jgi:acyl-CoA synthetase (NDP forming)